MFCLLIYKLFNFFRKTVTLKYLFFLEKRIAALTYLIQNSAYTPEIG
jgi:hypothetical protein